MKRKRSDVRNAEDILNQQKTKAEQASASKRKTKHKRLVTRTCSKTKRKVNSAWKSSKTTPKYDSEDCGHRSRRRRPNKSYNLTTSELRPQHVTNKKKKRKERKNEKNARRKRNRNRAREQGLREHELSCRERLQKIYEKCAHGYTWHHTKTPREISQAASLFAASRYSSRIVQSLDALNGTCEWLGSFCV